MQQYKRLNYAYDAVQTKQCKPSIIQTLEILYNLSKTKCMAAALFTLR